jgi:antitoxin (DNA-binding transcriptional repressor) of toxin-antitoxin stability system
MCHMKTISIRELHHKTGEWVRSAARFGEIHVSERGKTIAKIVPQAAALIYPTSPSVNSALASDELCTSSKTGPTAPKLSPRIGSGR